MNIEKNIPMPESATSTKYPFREMDVGDSIFFEGMNHKSRPAEAAKKISQRTNMHFASRVVNGGLRIWRVE